MICRRSIYRVVGAATLLVPAPLFAQSLDLTVHDVGVAIGDKPRVTGLRLNFRDRNLVEVRGINATLWSPYQPATGVVNGVALGLPVTGARRINGLAIGAFGVGADESMRGIGIAPLGLGAGGDVRGIMLGGLGTGAGGSVSGLAIGGLGVGSGGATDGIMIGGLGVGSGGRARGILIGGLGVGAGGSVTGISIGGLGAGAGGDVTGISIGGLGVGAGGNVTGLAIGGLGVGAGGTLRGVAIGGAGVGATRLRGLALAGLGAGGEDVKGVVIAGAYFDVERDGRLRGASLSAYNRILGTQRGLTVGLFNYAAELHGAQVGLLNVSDNGGHRLLLPVFAYRQ